MWKIYNSISLSGIFITLVFFTTSCDVTEPENEEKETGMYIYQLEKKEVSMNIFQSLVQKLSEKQELKGEYTQIKDDNAFSYVDDKQDIYYYQDAATGNFSFNRGIQKYLGNYNPDLPTPEEAQNLSMEFLRNFDFISPGNNELKLIHSGGLRADAGDNGEVIDKMRTITYGRVIDSIPVMGSGSKIVVHVGDKHEITGLVYKWRAVMVDERRPVLEKEMITMKEAEEILKRNIISEFGEQAEVSVKEMKVVYYDGDGQYIQPVYGARTVVMLKLDENQTNEIPYLTFVPALKQLPEGLNLKEGLKEAQEFIKEQVNKDGVTNQREDID